MGNHSVKAVIKKGDMEQVKEYFDHCPDMLNHQDRYGWTPPHLAIHYHRLDVLRYLLEETTTDVNHVDNEGSTLLHHAMYFCDNHFDIVDYLLDSGKMRFSAIKDHHGYTALHLAFKLCSLKQIESIMDNFKGLKDVFNEKNRDDKTPLDLLKERVKGNKESLTIVEELQKHIEKKTEGPGGGSPATSRPTSPGSGSPHHSAHASGHSTPKGNSSGHSTPSVSHKDSGSGSKLPLPSKRSHRSSRKNSDDEGEDGHHSSSHKISPRESSRRSSRQSSRQSSRHASRQSSRQSSRHPSDDEGEDGHHSHSRSRHARRKPSDEDDDHHHSKHHKSSTETPTTQHKKKSHHKSSHKSSRQASDDEAEVSESNNSGNHSEDKGHKKH